MEVSCIVDSVAGKMTLVGEQNVMKNMGVSINPTAEFPPASHDRSFKMLNALDVVRIQSFCVKISVLSRAEH
jgi:hypothetical protein